MLSALALVVMLQIPESTPLIGDAQVIHQRIVVAPPVTFQAPPELPSKSQPLAVLPSAQASAPVVYSSTVAYSPYQTAPVRGVLVAPVRGTKKLFRKARHAKTCAVPVTYYQGYTRVYGSMGLVGCGGCN